MSSLILLCRLLRRSVKLGYKRTCKNQGKRRGTGWLAFFLPVWITAVWNSLLDTVFLSITARLREKHLQEVNKRIHTVHWLGFFKCDNYGKRNFEIKKSNRLHRKQTMRHDLKLNVYILDVDVWCSGFHVIATFQQGQYLASWLCSKFDRPLLMRDIFPHSYRP